MRQRKLTSGEMAVLGLIQAGYGPQNSLREVFFSGANEAVIFVKASDGTSRVMANLTNLAEWRAQGIIESDDALKRDWLKL